MREMMQYLNVVKAATSEEQKKELMKKGFVPVKDKKTGSQNKKIDNADGGGKDA